MHLDATFSGKDKLVGNPVNMSHSDIIFFLSIQMLFYWLDLSILRHGEMKCEIDSAVTVRGGCCQCVTAISIVLYNGVTVRGGCCQCVTAISTVLYNAVTVRGGCCQCVTGISTVLYNGVSWCQKG